jgi:hypothetical protein
MIIIHSEIAIRTTVKIEGNVRPVRLPNFDPSEQLSVAVEKLGGTFFGFDALVTGT